MCGWLAWQLGRPFRRTPLRRFHRAAVLVFALLLAVAAVLPILLPQLDPQPETVGVQDIFDGQAGGPGAWIRLRGRTFEIPDPPSTRPGPYVLVVDADRPLRAIVGRATVTVPDRDPADVEATDLTGRLAAMEVTAPDDLPIEATVAGTAPRIVPDLIVELDPVPKPVRATWWPLAIPPALLALMLAIGARAGYPVFRPTRDIDVLTAPLAPGERLPAAYGGHVGPNHRELADPGAALLLVRPGPKGNLLMAQPLGDDGGPAPTPVTIGGGWTAGRIGDLHTVAETVPALVVRSELVNATFLFARAAERDRVAALIAVDR